MNAFLNYIYNSGLSLYRGAKKHLFRVLALFFIVVLSIIYIAHQNSTGNDRYTNVDLYNSTETITYNIDTYTDDGTEISKFMADGLRLYSDYHGTFSNNRLHELDTVTIQTYSGDANISGSTIVAYPKRVNLILANKIDSNPIINELVKLIPKREVYRSKILVVKTLKGYPIAIFYGRNIKVYDTEINGSQVFKIDGHILYTFNATFTESDASLFL